MTSHQMISPETMAPAPGFSHVVVAAPGRAVYVAGQVAMDSTGAVVGATLAEQFEVTLRNVASALDAAGSKPEDIVSMVMYATDVQAYRDSLREIGAAYRTVIGRHFPAMALVGVTELVEPDAMIEIVATAVIAD